ncbi:beta-L-arabinofuranosidase domain-containing protein [Changpingibacter yushuensis]|uniref:beta-L-arabinofuranosidase domain-containing protein n=1 Tax=Changpingibacter yushuensis TaxID=2758440 RepID=UPI001C710A71|nr:beta-L-arabinofuranosidase domain-containing protein [Changpingibacter yushuensis]
MIDNTTTRTSQVPARGNTQAATPVDPIAATPLRPGSMNSIKIDGGFWGKRQSLNRTVTLPHEVKWLEKFGTLSNFDAVVAGTVAQSRVGREFADSDVYKVLEALAWESGREPSDEIEQTINALLGRVLPALEPDGYLSTKYGHPGEAPRYSDMEWGHELYCYGHLIQAGVARLRTGHTASDPLAALAIKVADHVCATFGESGLQLVCGHPEIEVALVELYRATGEERYLGQANLFIERRGHHTLPDIEFGRTYFQDETPVRDMHSLEGHAVRALYLAAGAIDTAIETGDSELLQAVTRQYEWALARRTYITGGMGSHHQDEAFGDDFELPADRAYCETCAGVGSIMVAWRLLLATGNLEWGDVIERVLYNIVATSPSGDGRSFFYANTLHQREPNHPTDPEEWSPRAANAQRSAWFEVSCCPPNVSRTLAQLASYVATSSDNGIQIIQYMSGNIRMPLPSGGIVALRVETDYPNDSSIRIHVVDAPSQPWNLTLRIPRWAESASVAISHSDGTSESGLAAGPAHVIGNLRTGDSVVLDIPITARFTYPDPRIDAVRGCVALERGPLVMCVQSVEQPSGTDVAHLYVDPSQEVRPENEFLVAHGLIAGGPPAQRGAYSREVPHVELRHAEVVFSPYWAWANSGSTTMRVWVPTTKSLQFQQLQQFELANLIMVGTTAINGTEHHDQSPGRQSTPCPASIEKKWRTAMGQERRGRLTSDNNTKPSNRVTLEAVAALAGVSISTASKALSGRQAVSDATKTKVLAAASELDFHPNRQAQSLALGQSGTVGMITHDLEGRFANPIMMGAEDAFGVGRVSVLLCNSRGDAIREQYHINALLGHRVDGLIVVGARPDPRSSLGQLSVPVVYAYAPSDDPHDMSVTVDNRVSGRLAVEHLLECGRRRIAVISGDSGYGAAVDRVTGAAAALANAGLSIVGGQAIYGAWTESWGRGATRALMEQHGISRRPGSSKSSDEGIDAIICGSDQIARGCLDALRDLGISVPDCVAVVGHDNWESVADGARPPLTSIDMNLENLGRHAANLLLRAIEGHKSEGIEVLPSQLVVRGSTVA